MNADRAAARLAATDDRRVLSVRADPATSHHYPEIGVPLFWPFGLVGALEETTLDNLKYLGELDKTQFAKAPPEWTTPNRIALDLHTMELRDFSLAEKGSPVLVLAPYAGHSAVIADFHKDQSLVAALLAHGCTRVFVTDWKSATPLMRDYDIDNYLEEINVVVDELGARVALVGLCQGGWCAAMYASRFPEKVDRLVLAGSPIDTDAGEGVIKEMAHSMPMRFYESLVAGGDGVLKGSFMLEGFKNMHPLQQYVEKYVELYDNIEDPSYVQRFETFERWYEYTLDLPGRWYLQVIDQLFKENRLAKATFVALGRRIELKAVVCPVYLLAGAADDITPQEQVFAADGLVGTAPSLIEKEVAPGGHIGLFMGTGALTDQWMRIAEWLNAKRP
jgi:poly(3-hydroxybutyrate) depolymerase